MKVATTPLQGVVVLEPALHADARGFLFESFNRRALAERAGIDHEFVQENHSRSSRNVLRGLHYQLGHPQGKLVSVVRGEVFDVAVDVRRASPTFGRWFGTVLSDANRKRMWVPAGFAHGFLVLSEVAEVLYKLTAYWSPTAERTVAWDDPQIGIAWPLRTRPVLSERDAAAPQLSDAEVFP